MPETGWKKARRLPAGGKSSASDVTRNSRKQRIPPTLSGADVFEIPIVEMGNSTARKYRRRYLEILTAAARQFSLKGYQAATTKHIADELGVRQGTLYYYIPSKEH